MTAPTAPLDPEPSSSRTARLFRGASRWGGRAAWALGDQAAVSLGNFVTNIVLARELTRIHGAAEYGAFTMLLEMMLLLNQVQTALVTYPLSVKGAVMPTNDLRRLAGAALALTAVLLLPLAGVMFATAGVLDKFAVGVPAVVAMAMWQVHETLRRAMMSHLRYRAAVVGDMVSYLGQATAIVLMASLGRLTLGSAFAAIAVTSALAICVQVIQVGPRWVGKHQLGATTGEFWQLGRWMLFSGVVGILSTQAYLWTLKTFHGLETVAGFQALINLVKVTNPLLFSICGLIMPLAARLQSEVGVGAARNVAVRYGLLGLALLSPLYALLLLVPGAVIAVAYGPASAYADLTMEMRLIAAGYLVMYVTGIIGALLNALERGKHNLMAQLINLGATLTIAVPLTWAFGLSGALWGGLLTASTLAAALVYFLTRLTEPAGPRSKGSLHGGMS